MINSKTFFCSGVTGCKYAAADLVSGGSDGFREGKERQGQVHEAILECLQLFVSLDDLDELQTHQAHYCSCGSGDGRNNLSSDQFALGVKKEKDII